ncbi:MAG: hypothetical protein ACI8Z0_000390, partial [Lentimonas sp.]
MGKHGKYRALVIRTALTVALALATVPAQACRLALVLAIDVSNSVDETEDQLQRAGLANALLSPNVGDAFFISEDPVALLVFEWSGRYHQKVLVEWRDIITPLDLTVVSETIRDS